MGNYSGTVLATSGLVSYWELSEPSGTTTVDAKAVQNGTYTNATGFTVNQTGIVPNDLPNKSVLFTRANHGYSAVPDNASLHVNDTFTVEAIVNMPVVGTANQTVLCQSSNGFNFRITTTGALYLGKTNISDIIPASTTTMSANTTYHIATTKNGATSKQYINGVDCTGTVTNATIASPSAAMAIAGFWDGSLEWFGGNLQNVALYSTALSAATILAHYNATKASLGQPRIRNSPRTYPAAATGGTF